MFKHLGVILMVLLSLSCSNGKKVEAFAQFQSSLELYEAGEDYHLELEQSLLNLKEILEQGSFDPPSIYYNLSMGYYYLNKLDIAKVYTRKGLLRFPFDKNLKESYQILGMEELPFNVLSQLYPIKTVILFFLLLTGTSLGGFYLYSLLLQKKNVSRLLQIMLVITIPLVLLAFLQEPKVMVLSRDSYLYRGDSQIFDKVRKEAYPQGKEVLCIKERRGWHQVRLSDGTIGWLPPEAQAFYVWKAGEKI